MAKTKVQETVKDVTALEETAVQAENVSGMNKLEDDSSAKSVTSELAKWYVVNTYSGHEKKAAQQIKQRIKANGLEDEVLDVMVPTQEKIIAKEGKKRTVEDRIFPGYVLIKMIMNDQTWHVIRNTEGVTGFVGPTGKPSPLPEQEVKAILAYTQVQQKTYQASFKVGESVRVATGPFKDFVGQIQEINEGKGQLSVLLSIFGRETPVQLDFLQVTNL
jgi:transcription termination/antitermination protein NusG